MLLKPKCFVFPQTFLFVLKIAEATIKIYLHMNVLKVCRNFRFPPLAPRDLKKKGLSNKTIISQSQFDVGSHVKTEENHARFLSNEYARSLHGLKVTTISSKYFPTGNGLDVMSSIKYHSSVATALNDAW